MLLAVKENVECREMEPLINHFLHFFLCLRWQFSAIDPLLAAFGIIINLCAGVISLFSLGLPAFRGRIIFQNWPKYLLLNTCEKDSVPAVSHSLEERREKECKVEVREAFSVGLIKLLQENIAKLQRDTLAHCEFFCQHFRHLGCEPSQEASLIVVRLQEEEGLMELEAENHEILIDAIVVDLVPVKVEDVEECLKPLLLVSHSALLRMTCAYVSEQLCDLSPNIVLILRLIRVPECYTEIWSPLPL